MSNLMKTENNPPARQDNQAPERYLQPRASVLEISDSIILELEMPGVGRDNIEVSVEHDELIVSGIRRQELPEGTQIVHQERVQLNYRRSFVLSERIDTSNIAASYENGVLKLTLHKSEQAKPKKITIN